MDSAAKAKETAVSTAGNTTFSLRVKSPTFACVRKTSRNEVTTAAFEDFITSPANSAIKLMLTITADVKISWT